MSTNVEMPRALRIEAITYARKVTGIDRPVMEHRVYIEAFESCFKFMVEQGMIKEEHIAYVRDESGT